jgi:hypothetical protein
MHWLLGMQRPRLLLPCSADFLWLCQDAPGLSKDLETLDHVCVLHYFL